METASPWTVEADDPRGEKLFGMERTAKLVGVHYNTLYKWVRAGLTPRPYRVGTVRLFSRDDVNAIILLAMERQVGPYRPADASEKGPPAKPKPIVVIARRSAHQGRP